MNQMSKSQKRKQRLLRKGAQVATTAVIKVQPQAPRRTRRARKSRNRNRSRRVEKVPDYLAALIDPRSAEGVKVPDEVGYPTGTFQLEKSGILTTGTGGDTVGIKFVPVIGDQSSVFPIVTLNGIAGGTLSSITNVDWTNRSSLVALFQAFRPVSAVMELQFIGPSTADGGRIVGGCTFLGSIHSTPVTGTFATWQDYPEMEVFPVKNGIRVVWKPLDNANFEFRREDGSSYMPILLAAATGLPSATSYIMYSVCCNFEAVPKADTVSLVDTEPSPYDASALRKAFLWAQEGGNAVSELVAKIGPYIETGISAYNMLSGPAGWPQLPQRERRRSNRRRLLPQIMHAQHTLNLDLQGKEEESDDEIEGLNEGIGSIAISKSSGTPSNVGSNRNDTPSLTRKGSFRQS